MEEELKRERSKVEEVGHGSPKLWPLRQWVIPTPDIWQMDYLSVRKGRFETEIQLQRGHHFDLLRGRHEWAGFGV